MQVIVSDMIQERTTQNHTYESLSYSSLASVGMEVAGGRVEVRVSSIRKADVVRTGRLISIDSKE